MYRVEKNTGSSINLTSVINLSMLEFTIPFFEYLQLKILTPQLSISYNTTATNLPELCYIIYLYKIKFSF